MSHKQISTKDVENEARVLAFGVAEAMSLHVFERGREGTDTDTDRQDREIQRDRDRKLSATIFGKQY